MNLSLRNVVEWHVALSVAAAASAAWTGVGHAGSLAAGSLWALANLGVWAVLVRTLVRARQGGAIGGRARWVAAGALIGKFALFLGVITVVLFRLPLEPLSFAAGVTMFTLALLTSTAASNWSSLWREA
ncbi:MAG: hypothetical protein N3C12_14920 [Candidatus Binatia bacterium]|nr:hypothetical protein [Candidatus Binatia bacterium]